MKQDLDKGRPAQTGLNNYRVLDLTDEKGYLCGKILGDLGAEVIKIEPPGGDPGRFQPPFFRDTVNPEKSLPWWAFNTSKKSVTLDIADRHGKAQLLKLVKTSDVVLESFVPGYLHSLALTWEDLKQVNPRIILVSISGFGQTGPYAGYQTPDIIIQAMSGYMNLIGQMDRSPVRISLSHAHLHACNDAATAAVMALYYRERTGRGQAVDISAQECMLWATFSNHAWYEFRKVIPTRLEAGNGNLNPGMTALPAIFQCKDGYVVFTPESGQQGPLTINFLKWMEEQGVRDEKLSAYDWTLKAQPRELTEAERVKIRDESMEMRLRFTQMLLNKTKRELFQGAIERGFMLAPVNTIHDILDDPHFAARQFWQGVKYPGIGKKVRHPGAPFRLGENGYRIRSRAPQIGEHNEEVLKRQYKPNKSLKVNGADENVNEIFQGLKVLDLTWVTVGPRAVRYLADHGATVVKIEAPGRPDIGRLVPPYRDEIPHPDRSTWFANYNLNRYGTSIDISKPEGKAIALKLAQWADVLIESYRPGVMKKLGLDYAAVRKINPSIIYASTSQLGQFGPSSRFGGFGHHAAGMNGFSEITGWPDRPPKGVFWAYTDHIAPQFLITAITTALIERRRTGAGNYIDQSQNESAIQFLAVPLLDYQLNGRVRSRMGNRDPYASPHGAFRCKGEDRWCVIAVSTEEQWRVFCRVTDQSQLAIDPRFATLALRQANEDELERIVENWTLGLTPYEVMQRLQGAGIAAGVVKNAQDIDIDPQLSLRQHYITVNHNVMREHLADALPPRFSATPAQLYRASPCIGEHNAQVCTEILGMSDEEFILAMGNGAFGPQ
ncbi:MAG: CoA transferase [Dehalococcoidales bacterium]|nr:CoA transferase [Dehalococcoidales bacterium]